LLKPSSVFIVTCVLRDGDDEVAMGVSGHFLMSLLDRKVHRKDHGAYIARKVLKELRYSAKNFKTRNFLLISYVIRTKYMNVIVSVCF